MFRARRIERYRSFRARRTERYRSFLLCCRLFPEGSAGSVLLAIIEHCVYSRFRS